MAGRKGKEYEREIEQIIQEKGEFLKGEIPVKPADDRVPAPPSGRSFVAKLTPGKFLMASLALLLVGLLLWTRIPAAGRFVALTGVILFLLSYAYSLAHRSTEQKRWRGLVVRYTSSPSVWDR
ncbi:MAG: hypothetical protein HY685_03970, partial [Chloroflexi bacterium]|nr:hypothetical protein [Chloroflexota bacterium]